jgi:hypothetical protein
LKFGGIRVPEGAMRTQYRGDAVEWPVRRAEQGMGRAHCVNLDIHSLEW